MTFPDAHVNPSETLNFIASELAAQREDIDLLKKALLVECVYTVKQLGARYRFAPSTASHCPWKLPNFGRRDVSQGWKRETVAAWYARPEDERRREWEEMAPAKRRKAQGRAA